jgi:hypothetical protein
VFFKHNNYATYGIDDVPLILDYKIVFGKGKFNGVHEYYNIRTDPDLDMGRAALQGIACGCEPCKDPLKTPWIPQVDKREQPCYGQNEEYVLQKSYKGANDWKIFELVLRTVKDEKGVQ